VSDRAKERKNDSEREWNINIYLIFFVR